MQRLDNYPMKYITSSCEAQASNCTTIYDPFVNARSVSGEVTSTFSSSHKAIVPAPYKTSPKLSARDVVRGVNILSATKLFY